MRFWKSIPGTLLLVLLLGTAIGAGALFLRVHQVVRPPRRQRSGFEVAAVVAKAEEVRFRSVDGIEIAGWIMRGRSTAPAILLCHDFGADKSSLLSLAVPLHAEGFTVLTFDFRGHGQSGGSTSTLGLAERRDIVGAVDYLFTSGQTPGRWLGVYGVGMGAYAAVLAARDRQALRVLVLDTLYPDVSYPLVRRVYAGWPFGVEHLGSLARATFRVMVAGEVGESHAAEVLPILAGRQILLVAPDTDSRLAEEMERMYRSIPEVREGSEGSLVRVPATAAEGLYGKHLETYIQRVSDFFRSRLARQA